VPTDFGARGDEQNDGDHGSAAAVRASAAAT
jgi:hypothetical protein